MEINIFDIYELLRGYHGGAYDEIFYNATEGEAQRDILREILAGLLNSI